MKKYFPYNYHAVLLNLRAPASKFLMQGQKFWTKIACHLG